MTKLYQVFVTVTAMPLETVSAKDFDEAIAKVRAIYPHHSNALLTAILIKKINWPPPSKSEE